MTDVVHRDAARDTAPANGGRNTDGPAERRERSSQSFWTVVVGVPAVFSVLRLGVEAGGELQTTLLLVANVGPVNLVAGMFTTAARFISTALVAVFAIGSVLAVSADRLAGERRDVRRPLFARWLAIVPPWFIGASFAVAVATWQILYLPLLLPALAATLQVAPERLHERPVPRTLIIVALLGAYFWLLLPTLLDAWVQDEWLALLLLVAPPILALAITGPVPRLIVQPLAVTAQTTVLAMLVWAALPVITAPVLPLTVTTVSDGDSSTEGIRGHVVTVDDVNVVILQEQGGVRYVPIDRVAAQVLCPTESELPRHRLWIRDFHVDDSLLEGLGRRVRPVQRLDAACRAAPVD